LHKIEAHQGSPIWCIDISEHDTVYTGGGDGSVNSWPLKHINFLQNHVLLENHKHIFPKHVYFIDNSNILIYSNFKSKHKIFLYNNAFQLLNSYDLPKCLSSYYIMELSANRQCMILASIEGNIALYKSE
jgi:WD40 repeat protein